MIFIDLFMLFDMKPSRPSTNIDQINYDNDYFQSLSHSIIRTNSSDCGVYDTDGGKCAGGAAAIVVYY